MQRRHRKTLRLSLLPGELAAPDEIERNAYNRQQSPAKFLLGPKLMHPDVVILVEAGERIRIALFVRGAQIVSTARQFLCKQRPSPHRPHRSREESTCREL